MLMPLLKIPMCFFFPVKNIKAHKNKRNADGREALNDCNSVKKTYPVKITSI